VLSRETLLMASMRANGLIGLGGSAAHTCHYKRAELVERKMAYDSYRLLIID
jgi:hypothetical protein